MHPVYALGAVGVRPVPATTTVALDLLQVVQDDVEVEAARKSVPFPASAASQQVLATAVATEEGHALALKGVAARADRSPDMAVFMAVVPEGRPALAAQAAQVLIGAVRATQRAVGDAVQLSLVRPEGLAGADRAQK